MADRVPSIEPSDDGPDDREGFLVRTPYRPHWVEQLKALVPSRDRRFFESSKGWWVAEEHRDGVQHITLECFGELEVIDENGEVETLGGSGERVKQERLF